MFDQLKSPFTSWPAIVVSGAICVLSRDNRIFVVAFTLLALAFATPKGKRTNCLVAATSVILSFIMWNSALLPALGITSGNIREALSLPPMQTTHCYQLHKDELSQENIEALQTPCYISLGELANLYSPQIADDVKARYNFEDDELVDYLSTYASLGLRYPEGYLETFLSKLYGYWYPTAHSIDITESTPMTSVALSDFSPQEDAIELEDEETSGNTRNYTDALPAIKSAPKMLLNVFAGAPFTALLFSARVLPVGMLASRTIPRHNMQSQRFRLRTHCRDYADLLRLSPQRIAALCAAARLSASHTPGMARN